MTVFSPQKTQTNPPFRWTVDVFYRAADAGVFDDSKEWELINGQLWKREEVNPPHAILTRRIARLFTRTFEPMFFVSEEKPLHLSNDGEPVPDVYVATGNEADFEEQHPTNREAVLVVEVADATVTRDTGEKALLYAQAGIVDYWVSLVNERELVVFRAPTPDGYQSVTRLTETDTISPLCAPRVSLLVGELLARPATNASAQAA